MAQLQSRIERPDQMDPADLDGYLAAGWRPMGQSIYTAHFAQFDDGHIYSTLCTRLPLEGYSFSKSRRKLMRRNDQRFDIQVRPARLTARKRIIARRYDSAFPHRQYPTLEFHLYNDKNETVLNTHELEVYHDGQLVAFSFFDLGKQSLYSKIGIYDPAWRGASLGIYTMFKEIEWAMARGYRYYYPGYVVPGYPEFDYKHRVGPLDFLDLYQRQWIPFSNITPTDVPLLAMEQNLGKLAKFLDPDKFKSRLFRYRHFDLSLVYDLPNITYLSQPAFLMILSKGPHPFSSNTFHAIVTFNFATQHFEFLQCRFLNGLAPPNSTDPRYFDPIVLVKKKLNSFKTAAELSSWISQQGSGERKPS